MRFPTQDQTKSAWNGFCDAMDRLHAEQAKIKARNEQLRAITAAEIRRILTERKGAR